MTPLWFVHFNHQGACWNSPVRPDREAVKAGDWRARWCRERDLFPEQVKRWRQAAQDANAQPLLRMAEQRDLEKRHQQDQREIKQLPDHGLRLPEIEALLELDRPQMCLLVPSMYGGFSYRLESPGVEAKLISESWCRVLDGSAQRHEITSAGSCLVAGGFV